MSYSSIKNIRDKISNIITSDKTLNNVNVKCIVKKVSSYPHMTYIDVCDINNLQDTITATIHSSYLTYPIAVNDVLIMSGDIIFFKSVTLKVKNYCIDKPQLSNYEKIMTKLREQGLLSIEKKKIPKNIINVGIISSLNAAALKDCLNILYQCNLENIFIYPVSLQGKNMESSVINAINKANIHLKCDILLLVRGGGSRADLEWFDNYNIAKHIIHSNIPIICGIGHEIDHSIMDMVCVKSFNTPTHVATYIRDKNLLLAYNIQQNIKLLDNKYSMLQHQLTKIDKCIDGVIERECKKIKYKCENKVNELSYLLSKIDKSVLYYKKNYKYLKNNNCKTTLINKMENMVNYINSILTVSIYDKTLKSIIVTKNDLQQSYNNGNDIVIKFMDGEIKFKSFC